MRIFGSIIEALVLPVFDTRYDFPLGRSVAFQVVGNNHWRSPALLLQELAK